MIIESLSRNINYDLINFTLIHTNVIRKARLKSLLIKKKLNRVFFSTVNKKKMFLNRTIIETNETHSYIYFRPAPNQSKH